MNIYADPTELRASSRVIVKQAVPLVSLERVTGADMLLTPLRWPEDVPVDCHKASWLRMQKHLDAGAVLIQRKSGADFIKSIPKLKAIQMKMLRTVGVGKVYRPGRCWLVVTGITVVGDKIVACNGANHSYSFCAAEGALLAWKLRGGNVEILASDEQFNSWLDMLCTAVEQMLNEPIRAFSSWQELQKLAAEPDNWLTTRLAFPPGVGRKKLEALARTVKPDCDPVREPPSLLDVIDAIERGIRPTGWGDKLISSTTSWWKGEGK